MKNSTSKRKIDSVTVTPAAQDDHFSGFIIITHKGLNIKSAAGDHVQIPPYRSDLELSKRNRIFYWVQTHSTSPDLLLRLVLRCFFFFHHIQRE